MFCFTDKTRISGQEESESVKRYVAEPLYDDIKGNNSSIMI